MIKKYMILKENKVKNIYYKIVSNLKKYIVKFRGYPQPDINW